MTADLTNKNHLLAYLKQHQLWARKGLSQNFLVDKNALDKIVKTAVLSKDDFIIEIGPGLGTLTQELVKKAGEVIAIEMDDKLSELLFKNITISNIQHPLNNQIDQLSNEYLLKIENCPPKGEAGKLKIICDDITKVNLEKLIGNRKYKVVANIPYHITSKILKLFLSREHKPETMVLLVQKEVAERVCAEPGEMSILSVSVQLYGKPSIVKVVPKESFYPSPKVNSAILKIDNIHSFCHSEKAERSEESQAPKRSFAGAQDDKKNAQDDDKNIQDENTTERDFFRLVHIGFAARRKTLVNNLSAGYGLERSVFIDILKKINLGDRVRAQELSIQNWFDLFGNINI